MNKTEISILLLSNDASGSEAISKALFESSGLYYHVQARSLSQATQQLTQVQDFDIVLLDGSGLDLSRGKDVVQSVLRTARDIPVILVSNRTDHDLALWAMEEGAADNVVKGDLNTQTFKLSDVIEFSMRRKSISRKIADENSRAMRDLARDAASELHSVRKSHAETIAEKDEETADALKNAPTIEDDRLLTALRDISQALAKAQHENAILHSRIQQANYYGPDSYNQW